MYHSDTEHSAGLLQTSDQPNAETSIWKVHNILKKGISMPSVEFETPVPANELSKIHTLDHVATGIDKSLTYSFYLAMEKHHKAQEIENKLAIYIVKS